MRELDPGDPILRNTDFAEPERSEALRLLHGSDDPGPRGDRSAAAGPHDGLLLLLFLF